MQNMVNMFNVIDVVGCADKADSRAQWMADRYNIKKMTVDEIMNDPEIQVVVNLTYPKSHYEISKMAFEHGKHVYCEKMMAPTFKEATELMELAKKHNCLYTTAPDTFLMAWSQSARFYLDAGIVGDVKSVHAQCTQRYQPETPFFTLGHEIPKYYFFPLDVGGGFPFDIGGYYLHAMINLFGSIKRVTGFGGNVDPVRTYTNPRHPKYGEKVEIDTPTTMLATLEFENGVLGTFHFSSDSSYTEQFMVIGRDGSLKLGDPNMSNDRLELTRANSQLPVFKFMSGEMPANMGMRGGATPPWVAAGDNDVQQLCEVSPYQTVSLPILHGYTQSARGIGLADMCYAILNNRRPRCHADIGYHAIEVIHGIQESCKTGKIYEMTTRCPRPEPLKPSMLSETAQEATLDD